MIGVDTHVLVRYRTQCHTRQSALATRLIESLTSDAPGFVSHVVLVEMAWVLESCYAVALGLCSLADTRARPGFDGID